LTPKPLFYEELVLGDRYQTAPRTVTEADVVAFVGLSGDANPLHTDAEFAKESRFGERIAHGLLGLSICGGFLSRVGVIDGTAVALLGVEWRFRGPVLFGDTVKAEIQVAEKRETRNPDQGIVRFGFVLSNQRDEPVQEGSHTFMVKRRSP
jgi:acyl dehydratase